MESPAEDLVRDIKLSTVVPATITGEDKINHHLTNMDLAVKLHYITTVHFFGGDAAEGLSIQDLKKPMFQWLQLYYTICGRVRRSDGGGRPYLMCNDSGVRIVEATCTKTVAEWLAIVDGADHHRLLVYHRQPLLAHDFGFTPLVFLQLTKFKCGGLCVGMRWAHILGDAFSASECINMLGNIMANIQTAPSPFHKISAPTINHQSMKLSSSLSSSSCRSIKLLESLGDNWLIPNNSKMQMHTFHFTEKKLSNLLLSGKNKYYKVEPFELVSAIIWKSVAKIRETIIVTVCKKRSSMSLESELPSNGRLVIGIVEAQTMSLTIADSDPVEIAKLIAENFTDETSMIEKRMEEGNGSLDVVLYGSNLTFVDLEEVNLYGLQLKGRGPVFANLSIGGVGDKGAIVVVPDSKGVGRVVNVILPEDQLQHLKNELRVEWGIL